MMTTGEAPIVRPARTSRLLGSGALCLAAALPCAARAQQANPLAAAPLPLSALAVRGAGDYSGAGQAVLPPSSVIHPGDAGKRAHSDIQVFVPADPGKPQVFKARPSVTAAGAPPYSGYYFNTPASLACVYGLATATAGCDPETLTSANNAVGGSNTVGVIVIGTVSSLRADVAAYASQFGLPAPTNASLQIATQSSASSASGTGYDLAGMAAIETVHALAPGANILVVQCTSNSVSDLEACISFTASYGQSKQAVITASTAEFSGETGAERYFGPLVYFAAAGDGPGVQWPAASPSVVAVGGTSLSRRNDQRVPSQYGFFRTETAWANTGGGVSAYFQIPSYQSSTIASRLQTGMRGVPDISFDADPKTPVWVYCSSCSSTANPPVQSSSWYAVGGTGVSAAGAAAIANNSGKTYTSGAAQLAKLYSNLGNANALFDVSYGTCGVFAGYGGTAGSGPGDAGSWDFCTGLGSPRGTGAF